MIRGRTIELRPFDAADLETIRCWINDPEVNRWMQSGHIPVSAEAERAFFDATIEAATAGSAYRFQIHALDDGRVVGVTGLEHVSLLHRHAEIGIFLGAGECGRGMGRDALETVIRFAFDTLGLHTVRICVYPENARAHALYRSLGFTETGRDRESWFLHGAFRDLIRLDMTEDEWRARSGPST